MRYPLFLFWLFIQIFIVLSISFGDFRFSRMAFENESVKVSLQGAPWDKVNIYDILEGGVEVKIIYHLTLMQKGSFLFQDETVKYVRVIYQIQKDLLNDGYGVEIYLENDSKGRWFKDYRQTLEFIGSLDNYQLLPVSLLEDDQEYYIRAYQEVKSLELYPPLSFVYNLLGNWNYTSEKINSRSFNQYGILYE